MRQRQHTAAGWPAALMGGVVLGAALQLQQAALGPAWGYAGLLVAGTLAACIALVFVAPPARVALVLVAAMAAAFGGAGLRAAGYAGSALPAALEGRDIAVVGRIAAMPQRSDTGQRFRFEVESARMGRDPAALPPQLLLGWYTGVQPAEGGAFELQRGAADLRPGDRWQFTVRLKAPHGHLNPGGFDYELWLWEQGLQATGYVRSGPRDPAPRRLEASWRHPVEQARHRVREAIYERVADRRLAGVLAALVVGDQAAIERADWDVFRATGVAHLMSISGLHITMFAWAAAALVRWLWRRSTRLCLLWPAQHAALAGGLLLAAAYALFSGWGVPAQRTILMLGAVSLLRMSGRRWPWPWVWLLACAVVVVADPWALTQAGFWLSFAAVGVLFATEPGGNPPATHAARLRALLREQWVVTAALAPLTLLLFGQVSVVGLLANLVAIPWVTLVVTPLAMAGVLLAPLWTVAAWSVQGLSEGLRWLAALPWATVSVPAAPAWAAAAGLAGGLLLVMRWPWPLRALGVPLLAPVLLWQPARPAPGEFELIAADVGQGNAVIVRTASHTLVYDAGPRYGPESDAGHRVLVPLLRHLGERVDMLVLSHRDADHTGGAAAVLAMQQNARLLSSLEEAHELQAVRRSESCLAGQSWRWDGVDFRVLHPGGPEEFGAARPNAISCVLKVSNAGAAALLAGDIEQPQEARLVAEPGARRALAADLLLVPHHGSKTSSSEPFLDTVQPAVALVQAGYRNRFGHPAGSVIARYRQRGIEVVESARCGAARWRSERRDQVTCERAVARRYWHHAIAPRDSP